MPLSGKGSAANFCTKKGPSTNFTGHTLMCFNQASDSDVVPPIELRLRTFLKSRVGAPANYNYQSATCPPDPSTLEITELNSKKCSVAPNSLRVSYHNSHMSITWHVYRTLYFKYETSSRSKGSFEVFWGHWKRVIRWDALDDSSVLIGQPMSARQNVEPVNSFLTETHPYR